MIMIAIDLAAADALLVYARIMMDVSCCLSVIGWSLAFAAWLCLTRR